MGRVVGGRSAEQEDIISRREAGETCGAGVHGAGGVAS